MSSAIATAALREWMLKALTRKGQFAADAELVIARLLEAEQRGCPFGGLGTFAEILSAIDLGDVDPRARTLTVTEAPAMAVLDGSTGIGQVGATRAMAMALQRAPQAGIALVVVKNSQPLVDVAGIAALAAKAGCIGFCAGNWGKADAETGWLSAQPQAWALPQGENVWISLSKATGLDAALAGVLSLALTAGLTDSKLPSAKKRASPFGAGAEYACLAIDAATFSAVASLARIGVELAAHSSDGSAGWSRLPCEAIPESVTLSAEVRKALIEAGQAARVPFPAA